jgi:hypothetical protein
MFHFGHLQGLKLEEERLPLFPPHPAIKKYVLMAGDTPVLLLVLVPIGVGNQEVVLFPGEKIKEHRKTVISELSTVIDNYMQTEGLTRMQANTKDESKYHRFMSRLGFKIESVLEKYSDGADYLMWAKIRANDG